MKAKFWTGAVILLLVIFLVAAVASAWRFLSVEGDLTAQLIGAGTLLVVAVGIWFLAQELWFGVNSEKLGRILDAEGGLPEDTVERSPGGRPNRKQADEQFQRYAAEAEAAPDDWRSWFRLAVAYDVASDRSRARKTMRKAIKMHKARG